MAAAVSITDPGELAEVDQDEDDRDEDEFAPERVSFFAGDQHEREIATSVWRIYLRESVDRSFEEPGRARRLLASARLSDRNAANRERAQVRAHERTPVVAPERAPAVPPAPSPAPPPEPPPPPKEPPMKGDLSERVTEHHAALRKLHGRNPTNVELVAAVGASVEAVRGMFDLLRRERGDRRESDRDPVLEAKATTDVRVSVQVAEYNALRAIHDAARDVLLLVRNVDFADANVPSRIIRNLRDAVYSMPPRPHDEPEDPSSTALSSGEGQGGGESP